MRQHLLRYFWKQDQQHVCFYLFLAGFPGKHLKIPSDFLKFWPSTIMTPVDHWIPVVPMTARSHSNVRPLCCRNAIAMNAWPSSNSSTIDHEANGKANRLTTDGQHWLATVSSQRISVPGWIWPCSRWRGPTECSLAGRSRAATCSSLVWSVGWLVGCVLSELLNFCLVCPVFSLEIRQNNESAQTTNKVSKQTSREATYATWFCFYFPS